MNNAPISPLQVNEDFVLAKCSSFVDFQLWPVSKKLNPEAWLENFNEAEKAYALHLLNAFVYFSDDLIDQLFSAAFQNLSSTIRSPGRHFQARRAAWQSFYDAAIITHVTGEQPSTTDSGYIFARRARQILEIEEERILSPDNALNVLIQNSNKPIVFVDDFVGSGQQFIATWHRRYNIRGMNYSFSQVAAGRRSQIFYCPVFCTEYGFANIARECPAVTLSPGNIISRRYSVFDTNSIVWPDSLRAGALPFLDEARKRAGIPDTGGGVDDWRGFHKLGLTVAMSHSVPDATIPLFYWEENNWNPLIRRR